MLHAASLAESELGMNRRAMYFQIVASGHSSSPAPGLRSDGLWGTVSDTVIAEMLGRNAISDAVPELVEQALRNGGAKSDNVSVLAVEWESAEDSEGAAGVSTESLGDEVFASTIQASVLGTEAPDELDDAEIERSIREINEAIRRSSQQKKN